MGRLLSDLGGDWVKLEKTAPLFLEFFHDRGDPKGVFDPQSVGDVGTDELQIRDDVDVPELERRPAGVAFVEISGTNQNVIARFVVAVVVHSGDVTVELDGPACILGSEIGDWLAAVVRIVQDPGEILVVFDGEYLSGFRGRRFRCRFGSRLRGGLLGARGCHGFGRGRDSVVFLQRPDGDDARQDDTGAAECGPQSPGGLWLWSAEGHGGSQAALVLGDQFPAFLLLACDRFRLGAPDRLDLGELVLCFLAGHVSFRPSDRGVVGEPVPKGREARCMVGWDALIPPWLTLSEVEPELSFNFQSGLRE